MTVVVYIIGALLVIAGGAFISMGVPIVRLEIGWSEIIGGAVAGSAGFVILAIGVVLTRLQEMQRALVALNLASALRGMDEAAAPAWAPAEAPRAFSPHPLAPPAPRPPAEPAERFVPLAPLVEPAVEPEPSLAEAPLHGEADPLESAPPPATGEDEPAFALNEGAPALVATEDHAPKLPPVEPVVPPVTMDRFDDDEEDVPAFPPPPAPPPELTRTRPNFLASFLARRTAATERAAPRGDGPPPIEPLLSPLREPENPVAPPRTSIDLSSGWDEPAPVRAPPPEDLVHDDRPSEELPSEHLPSEDLRSEDLHSEDLHPEDLPPLLRPTHDPDGEHGAAPAEHLAARHEDFDAEEQRHDDERVLRGLRYDEEPARDEQSLDDEPPATAEVRPPVAAEPAPPTAATASEPDPASPVVVGRYNAGSASYIMYSNGMIEVETDSGTHQFASMQELKAFIERRDSAQV